MWEQTGRCLSTVSLLNSAEFPGDPRYGVLVFLSVHVHVHMPYWAAAWIRDANTYCECHSPRDLPDYKPTLHEFAFCIFSYVFLSQGNLKSLFFINAVQKNVLSFHGRFEVNKKV